MNDSGWLRVVVVGLASTHIAGLIGGHVLPWTGTLTMAAFLVYVWDAGPARRIGFAALAGVALSIDLRTGGTGFPNAFTDHGSRALEGALVAIGVVALAWSRRWTRLVAAVAVVLLAGPVMLARARPEPESSLQSVITAEEQADLIARMTARERLLHPGANVAVAVMAARPHETAPGPATPTPLPAMLLFAVLALVAQAPGARAEDDYARP
ncbi:hypothetical protein [Dactylosporangium sp. NPDC051541]|uniref:hypothetical protein n=1 Tax=Dactylosporangium sp. NPDC051541 TaxID=3363977 RepID=UPI0037A66974